MTDIILPFLKWAGGKRWLTNSPELKIPKFDGRYFEPFLGSGSLFFSLQPKRATLSDINSDLMETYIALRDEYARVLQYLRRHAKKHSKLYYYKVRDQMNPRSSASKAARFLYLNRTCWNGLYRVNLKGKFNVPKGTKSSVILESDDFRAVSKALEKVTLSCCDFEKAIDQAGAGDLIYADPPYTVRHNMNGFIKYNEVLFSWEDQQRLRTALFRASNRGARFLLSNADHASVRELYSDIASIKVVNRASIISADSAARGTTTELLVWNEF